MSAREKVAAALAKWYGHPSATAEFGRAADVAIAALGPTRPDPKTDHIVLSIGGRQRDIPVTVTDVLGLTSYRFELDLGVLGRQTVLLDLFHRETDEGAS